MKPVHAAAAALLAAVAASRSAHAQGAEDTLWVGPAAFVCLAEDPALQATPLGSSLAANAGYQNWRASQGEPMLACIAARKFLPAPLCAALFKLDAKSDPAAVQALHRQYAEAIDGLSRIGECE